MNSRVQKIIDKVTQNLNSNFGPRVINLVLFGSQLRDKYAEDIDLHLLLDEPENEDLLKISRSIPKSASKVDLLISYKEEFSSQGIFRIRAQGRYFLYPLSEGKILLGKKNFYKKTLHKQDRDLVIRDLLVKNKEYQNSLRDFLIERKIILEQKKIAKYLLRYINQTLLVLGAITYEEVLKLNKKNLFTRMKLSGLLSREDIAFIDSLSKSSEKREEKIILSATKILFRLDKVNQICVTEKYG